MLAANCVTVAGGINGIAWDKVYFIIDCWLDSTPSDKILEEKSTFTKLNHFHQVESSKEMKGPGKTALQQRVDERMTIMIIIHRRVVYF